jgi:hypothetical protein
MKKILILILSCMVLLQAATVFADPDDAIYAAADTVVARPLGIASIIVGTAFFIVALPFAITSGTTKETADTLIGEPFRFTFDRPVGEVKQMPTDQKNKEEQKK